VNFLKRVYGLGFIHLLTSNLLVGLTGFGAQLFVAGILSPEDIGDIKIFQNYIMILTILLSFGMNASLLKICSEKNNTQTTILFQTAFYVILISSVIAIPIIMIISSIGAFYSESKMWIYITIFSFTAVLININYIFIVYLQSSQKIVLLSKLQGISRLFGILVLVVLTYAFHIYGYFFGFMISYIITIIFFYKEVKKTFSVKKQSLYSIRKYFSDLWKNGKFAWGSNIFSQMIMYTDIFILLYFIDNKNEIGQYAFATIILLGFQMFTGTIQQITIPKISSKSHNLNLWKAAYDRYIKYIVLSSVIPLLISLFLYADFIEMVYAEKYISSSKYFYLLLFAWAIKNIYSFKGAILFGNGEFKSIFVIVAIAALINIFSGLIFINYYGMIGAGYNAIFINLLTYLFYSKSLKTSRSLLMS